MGRSTPVWIRLLLRTASRHASDAELGDVVEEYEAGGRSPSWLVSQVASIVRGRRSHLTTSEKGAEMLSNVLNDIRYTLRTLARSPGFAVAAILPIALGIGINTGIFSILNSVAWRPLPVPEPDALVSIHQDFRGGPRRMVNGARSLFSLPEYRTYRDESRTLSAVMAYSREWTVTLGRENPREIDGILVTCNYFDVLQLSPALGPGLTAANCAPDATPAVVLSYALWQGAFGADPQILQTPIVLNGRDVTVVGVAPPGFEGVDMAKSAFFAPTPMAAVIRPEQNIFENPHLSWLTMIGRRRADADLARVRADLALVAGSIDRQQPGRTTTVIVERAAALSLPVQRRDVLKGAGIVMAAFGLVLLIAAANVANILLARAASRTREIAIRVSIGATRLRVLQQLLTESAIIALAGAVSGTLLAWWFFDALVPWVLSSIPDADRARIDATPDRTVVWFALGLTAITALLFGLAPAVQGSAGNVHALTRQDGAGSVGGRGWIRGTLIGAQIALCTTLLIPAALLSRALYAAYQFDPGFDFRNVAVITIPLRGPQYEKEKGAAFHEQWLERVKSVAGVETTALVSRIPLSPGRSQTTFRLAGGDQAHVVDVNSVTPEFFDVVEIPLVRGRMFTSGEPDAVLVTESTARRYWPGQDALGRAIDIDKQRRHVVGIVRDAQVSQAREAVSSYLYLPARGTQRTVLARTRLDTAAVAAAVRAETSRMDPSLVVTVRPLSDNVSLLQTLSQITAGVAGTLSLLALGLAAIGLYGVVAYVVSRRLREVGVRMALGADARDVQRLIMRQTLRPVAIGMAAGIAAAAATVRLLQSVLYGVSPYDPLAFIGAPLLMLSIAAAAAFLPTRRAARVNPMSILRCE